MPQAFPGRKDPSATTLKGRRAKDLKRQWIYSREWDFLGRPAVDQILTLQRARAASTAVVQKKQPMNKDGFQSLSSTALEEPPHSAPFGIERAHALLIPASLREVRPGFPWDTPGWEAHLLHSTYSEGVSEHGSPSRVPLFPTSTHPLQGMNHEAPSWRRGGQPEAP